MSELSEQRNYSYNFADQNTPNRDENFIRLRLLPDRIMTRIELFLSNKRIITEYGEDGQLYEKEIEHGNPICNPKGINGILNMIEMTINEHTITGNLKEDSYNNFIANTRIELTKNIILKCQEWEIQDNSIEMVVDSIMRMIKLAISRTIDNLERESLRSGMQTREVVVHADQPPARGLGRLARGFG